jgi:tRNA dimethylallyltransferase
MLIVIGGATATGKSGLAVAIAQVLGSEIISADSRQVYKEFDIGTAKPSPEELRAVPHHLIDCWEPSNVLTLADYQQQAQSIIQRLQAQSITPLLVGGTGLYIKSIVNGLRIPRVPPDASLRSQLQTLGQSQCYAMLAQVDAIAANRIHPNDQTRTIRALEVFYTTGIPISEQQGECPPPYPILQIGLDCLGMDIGCDRLTQRIEHRTAQMIERGLVEEVERLCQRYGTGLPLLNTLGYQEVRDYLAGRCSLREAERLTVLHTRQFAKRQRTWFRADDRMEWFDSDDPQLCDRVIARIQAFIQTVRPSTASSNQRSSHGVRHSNG